MNLLDNKEIVLSLVREKGRILQYVSDRLKDDYDVVLEAVKQNGDALSYANSRFRKNRDIVLQALKSGIYDLRDFIELEYFLDDKEIVKYYILDDSYYLDYFSDELENDKDFILDVINYSYEYYDYVGKRLENDIDVLRAFRDNYRLNSCDCEFTNDWYKERMEVLEKLEFEEELKNSIKENNLSGKINKF